MFVVLRPQMVLRSKNRVNPSSSEKARFLTRFAAIALFLFVFIHFAALANFVGRLDNSHERQDEQETSIQPFHIPSQSATGIPIAEFLTETELEEKPFPDEDSSQDASLSLNKIENLDSAKDLQLQFLRSLQNRPTLSLIILHHSWKSFLS